MKLSFSAQLIPSVALFYMAAVAKGMFLKTVHESILFLGRIQWRLANQIEPAQLQSLYDLLVPNGYIILTMRRNHLSTVLINLVDFVLTGKRGFYAHALMNTDVQMANNETLMLIEATGEGVKRSTFAEVFDCHAVAVLRPRNTSMDEWTLVMDHALSAIGKPYNSLFSLRTDEAVTCASLVRSALMASPTYHRDFSHFERMVQQHKKLTPQMFYDCQDFEIVYEVRH